jgi:glutaminyl-peptide cyclotransferase
MRIIVIAIGAGLTAMAFALFAPGRRTGSAPVVGYKVVRSYPHDSSAFTQGLIFKDGFFYEGTGLVGRSGLRKVKVENGEVVQFQPLEPPYFGEGITEWKGTIVQLTWQSEVGFVYDLATFRRIRTFSYKGEGWGLTHDGTRLIMSDGSSFLRFLDPTTLKETGRLAVKDGGVPVVELNELEYVRGEIYANVWQTDRIARISPKTGQVLGWLDLRGLLSPAERARDAVLNGIAYDAKGDRLFVTGKLWPRVFEITPASTGARRDGGRGDDESATR